MEFISFDLTYGDEKKQFAFCHTPAAADLINEIFQNNYHVLNNPDFTIDPGDAVLDLGANEGMFSVLMASLFDKVLVIALEPVEETFKTLLMNVGLNNAIMSGKVRPVPCGVGAEKGSREIVICPEYSGGASLFIAPDPAVHVTKKVAIHSLDYYLDYVKRLGRKVKLLKIDVEGAEYEAIYASELFKTGIVENMVGEFHINNRLAVAGYTVDGLIEYCRKYTNVIHIERCKMAE